MTTDVATKRYLVADPARGSGWPHIFPADPENPVLSRRLERICEFVYDTKERRFVRLFIDGHPAALVFGSNDQSMMQDLEESLLQNLDLQSAADLGLESTDDIPARAPVPYQRPRPSF